MVISEWKQIKHNGFARQSLVRRVVERIAGGCSWCGNLNAHGKLFEYGTEPDDSLRVNPHKDAFCCKSCHDAYHEV